MNVGQQLSHYILEEKIGDGGFGDVFRARDLNSGMEVAIKCSRTEDGDNKLKDKEQRFMREVSCISKLRHPGIVQLFDYGTLPDGTLFLVMEYVCGLNLEVLIKRDAPFSYVYASEIVLQILDALSEAHNQGIVHRDLKPANIMLVRQGLRTDIVKLLDFGIAKAFNGSEPDLTRQNFQKGAGFGTPQYMPPEQFYGKKIGPHSDLYAVGLVFFELLTGKQAFTGKTLSEVIEKQLKVFPEIPEPFCEGPLDNIFRRALAKQINMRYASAAEMYCDIDAITRYQSPYLSRYNSVTGTASRVSLDVVKPASQPAAAVPSKADDDDDDFPNLDDASTVDTMIFGNDEDYDISEYKTLVFDGGKTETSKKLPDGLRDLHSDDEDQEHTRINAQSFSGYDEFEDSVDIQDMIPTDDMSRVSSSLKGSFEEKTTKAAKQELSAPKPKSNLAATMAEQDEENATNLLTAPSSSELRIPTNALPQMPVLPWGSKSSEPEIAYQGNGDAPDISGMNTLMVGADDLPPMPEEMSDGPHTEDLPAVFHEQRTHFIQKNGISQLRKPTTLGVETPWQRLVYAIKTSGPVARFLNSKFYIKCRHFHHRVSIFINKLYDEHFIELVVTVCLFIIFLTFILIIIIFR